MTKQIIKKMAESSYTNDELDEKKVDKIAKNLKKSDLKIYIKDLKIMEMKKTVTVSVPTQDGMNEMKTYFTRIYPGKRIVFNVDESLITGIRVVDYDNVYELSLKGFLEQSIRSTND